MKINTTEITDKELETLSKKELISLLSNLHLDNLSSEVILCSSDGHYIDDLSKNLDVIERKFNKEI